MGNSGRSYHSLIIVALLAAAGIFIPRIPDKDTSIDTQSSAAPQTSFPVQPPPATGAGSSPQSATTAFDLIRGVLKLPIQQSGSALSTPVHDQKQLHAQMTALRRDIPQLRLHWLICLVPDPIDSHMQVMSDLMLTSLQSAAQHHGFLLDRFHLPWKAALRNSASTTAGPSYHDSPGIMVFRSTAVLPSPELLVVLLVGETAPRGPHQGAMMNSLAFPAMWANIANSHRAVIPIVGPTFSGSCRPLRSLLDAWATTVASYAPRITHADVTFISGNATAESNKRLLTDKPAYARHHLALNVTFTSTVIPDDLSLPAVKDYLREHFRIPTEHTALLVEQGTTYGAGLSDPKDSTASDKWMILNYPMQIGRLRSEYDKSNFVGLGGIRTEVPVPRLNLKLPLEESPLATDLVPSFSPLTVAETERQLATLLATLARSRVRAIGIAGTDVKDILFLVEQVRLHGPDAQIFVLDSDILYAHPDFIDRFRGVLVASTYPLFSTTQEWTRPDSKSPRDLTQFPSACAEGTYNAVLALLNDHVRKTNKKFPVDYRIPFKSTSGAIPPLWMTVVGNDGFWPVSVKPITNAEDRIYSGFPEAQHGSERLGSVPSGFWPFVTSSVILGMLGYCVVQSAGADGGLAPASQNGFGHWLFHLNRSR